MAPYATVFDPGWPQWISRGLRRQWYS